MELFNDIGSACYLGQTVSCRTIQTQLQLALQVATIEYSQPSNTLNISKQTSNDFHNAPDYELRRAGVTVRVQCSVQLQPAYI